MFRLLDLSSALAEIAQQGSDDEVQHALELCYSFMERIEHERLGENKSEKRHEYLQLAEPQFLN
jgi:hypothetical protein